MTQAQLYAFCKSHRYAVLSSIGLLGKPESALVGFACNAGLEIIFDTATTSRKYKNLVSDKRCSLVIGWSGEQTLQYEGLAEEASGAYLREIQETYFAVWPGGRLRASWENITWFVIHPCWMRYSAYDQAPPFIQEFSADNRLA